MPERGTSKHEAVSHSASNASTLAGYEGCALDYAQTTAPRPEAGDQPALVKLLKAAPPGSRLLEIGSGPGWDADWLEERGSPSGAPTRRSPLSTSRRRAAAMPSAWT